MDNRSTVGNAESIPWVRHPEFGVFRRRLNRFAALVEREGREERVFLPNTGRLEDLLQEGRTVLLEKRRLSGKTLRDLLAIQVPGFPEGAPRWVGLDARFSATLMARWRGGASGSPRVGRSVLDLYFPGEDLYVETKSVNLLDREGCARFPDAPTRRGQRHLRELLDLVAQGRRAALWFVIFREDARAFCVFRERDPEFARLYVALFRAGVEVRAFRFEITPRVIVPRGEVPVCREISDFPGYWTGG